MWATASSFSLMLQRVLWNHLLATDSANTGDERAVCACRTSSYGMMAMTRRRRLQPALEPGCGECDGAEVSRGQPSSSTAVISLIRYRERMRSVAWLHQSSGRNGAQRFMGHWYSKWCNVSAGASWQKRQAPGVAADPKVEFDSGKRPPRMSTLQATVALP